MSRVSDQDPNGRQRAVPMGHAADTHQTAYTFAHMAVQTSEPTQIPCRPND